MEQLDDPKFCSDEETGQLDSKKLSTILPGDGHCHSKCIVSMMMYRMSYLLITNV